MWGDFLEKEMATHSSILARKIPWTEESGELESTRLQRVGQDCANEHACIQSKIYLREFICKIFLNMVINVFGFPGGSVAENLSANARDADSIPESGRHPREGNGSPLQYSC